MSVTTAGEEDVDDMNARGKFLTQQHTADSCDLIVLAAAAGDVSTMLQHLRTHPNEVHNYVCIVHCDPHCYLSHYVQVNRMVSGRAAIHEACKEGFIGVLKALLEYNPDLDIMVCMIIPLL